MSVEEVNATGDAYPVIQAKTFRTISLMETPGTVVVRLNHAEDAKSLMRVALLRGYKVNAERLAPYEIKVTIEVDAYRKEQLVDTFGL